MLLLVTRSSEFKQRAEECGFCALIAGEIGVWAVRSPSREEPLCPAQKILVCTGIGRGGTLRNISGVCCLLWFQNIQVIAQLSSSGPGKWVCVGRDFSCTVTPFTPATRRTRAFLLGFYVVLKVWDGTNYDLDIPRFKVPAERNPIMKWIIKTDGKYCGVSWDVNQLASDFLASERQQCISVKFWSGCSLLLFQHCSSAVFPQKDDAWSLMFLLNPVAFPAGTKLGVDTMYSLFSISITRVLWFL